MFYTKYKAYQNRLIHSNLWGGLRGGNGVSCYIQVAHSAKAFVSDVLFKISGRFKQLKSMGASIGGPQRANGGPPKNLMIYSRGPGPRAFVYEVLCKISGRLKQFNWSKSQGGPQRGQHRAPPGGLMIYSRGPGPKASVYDVLFKISGRLKQFNQFKSQGGPQRGQQRTPRVS